MVVEQLNVPIVMTNSDAASDNLCESPPCERDIARAKSGLEALLEPPGTGPAERLCNYSGVMTIIVGAANYLLHRYDHKGLTHLFLNHYPLSDMLVSEVAQRSVVESSKDNDETVHKLFYHPNLRAVSYAVVLGYELITSYERKLEELISTQEYPLVFEQYVLWDREVSKARALARHCDNLIEHHGMRSSTMMYRQSGTPDDEAMRLQLNKALVRREDARKILSSKLFISDHEHSYYIEFARIVAMRRAHEIMASPRDVDGF